MYKKPVITLIILFIACHVHSQIQRNIFAELLNNISLQEVILSPDEWHPYPDWNDTVFWNNLPDEYKTSIIIKAESCLDNDWGNLYGSLFTDYVKDGIRTRYSDVSFHRREVLATLVLAELIEREDRFIDDIVDGIWIICEESFWGITAHIDNNAVFPDVEHPDVDLFAAETGAMLSWISYIFGDRLDKISPLINDRIRYEVKFRILDPCYRSDRFWWMGYSDPDHINNWNPWINSNWLICALLIEDNQEKRIGHIKKIMLSLDNFLNSYKDDGGCDEGPDYWFHAGSRLSDCLEILSSVSENKINLSNNSLIRNIAEYIAKFHISEDYYIPFADSKVKVSAKGSDIYKSGKYINSENLMKFGKYIYKMNGIQKEGTPYLFETFTSIMPVLTNYKELSAADKPYNAETDIWFPDLQVMAKRFRYNKKDFYFAAKGGHNNENHNHNDIGNFVIYINGKPAIVDAGVETYTAKTFSDERYTIWTMQSKYHNLPTINGTMQKDGSTFRSDHVIYGKTKEEVEFSLDLHNAYPTESFCKYWNRKFSISEKYGIILKDDYILYQNKIPLELSLMTDCEIHIRDSEINLYDIESKEKLLTIFLPDNCFDISVEEIPLNDTWLTKVWGNEIYRLKLAATENKLSDTYKIQFK